jgi:integron integrase
MDTTFPSAALTPPPEPPKPRLLDQVRAAIRARHYSRRTEKSYIGWIRRFIFFHKKRHPLEMGKKEVSAYLTHLATARNVSASTQTQALSALLFLYRHVLSKELGEMKEIVRAKPTRRLPIVLSPEEVYRLMRELDGLNRLLAMLLYGSGMRLMESMRLRVKDIDFEMNQIVVRAGKGDKDRVTILPGVIREDLRKQIERARRLHERDIAGGAGWVELPMAIENKWPTAAREIGWQWVFPATRTYVDTATARRRRHHIHETVLQRAIKEASRRARIDKPVSCHTLRHTFATDLLGHGYDIRTVQELLGHTDVSTTMIYTHVLKRGAAGVRSPADGLYLPRDLRDRRPDTPRVDNRRREV